MQTNERDLEDPRVERTPPAQTKSSLNREAIATGFEGCNKSDYSTREESHGREEIRHYLMLSDIAEKIDPNQKWANLKSIGMVERSRRRSFLRSVRSVNGKTTVETRYYISSLALDAELLGQSVRSHWGIENSLHWGGSALLIFPPL